MVQYISRNFRGNFRDPKLFYMYQRLISKLMIELEKSFHTGPACRPLCRLLPVTLGGGLATRHRAGRHTLGPNEAVALLPTGRQPTGPKLLSTEVPSPRRAHAAADATAPQSCGELSPASSPCLRTTRASLPCTRAGTSSAASSPPQFRALSPPHGSSSISKLPAATSSASPGSPRESRRSARTGQPELPSHCRYTMEAGAVPSSELLCCPRRALVLHECRPSRC
jgi:hypothetical protein